MQDRQENSWFYRMCVRRRIKDMLWVIAGALLIILGTVLLFTGSGIAVSLIVAAAGALLMLFCSEDVFRRFPAMKEKLSSLSGAELEGMGETAPERIGKVFCFTEYFLCIPDNYALIRYDSISGIVIREKQYKGIKKGYYADLTFNDGTPKLSVVIRDRKFGERIGEFRELIDRHRTEKVPFSCENDIEK